MDEIAELFPCDQEKSYPTCVPKQVMRILESTPTGVVALDAGCRIIYINSQANRMLGKAAQGASGKPITFFIEEPQFVDWLVTGFPESLPPFPWRQGSIMVSASRQGSHDDPRGYLLFFQPSGSFEQIDERVNRLRKELSLLLENSYDGIIVADAETILNVNASFGRITGIAPSTVAGKKIADLDTERHICLAAISEVIRLTRFHRKTLTLQRRLMTGNEIFLTGTPVTDRHGQIVREVVNIRDITELKSLEDQIKKVTTICPPDPEFGDAGEGKKAFQGIVAESPSMRRLLDMVLRVSRVDSIVLLQGESGVGKDVFARLIHRLSERREDPFVSVNCGAIPESLLESEFFGYEKGAFTSADRNGKAGLFEQANGGVLFLDEVGELPLNLQVKLLKVLQDRRCRRLGGTRNIDLDLRIIAATNRDLRKMVSEGSFRMDLFYRLHVVPIEIAPLRERQEDILPLALMFLNHFNRKYDASRTLGHELMSVLEDHEWPGNVRELQNLVERLVVTADEDALSIKHLPSSITKGNGPDSLAFRLPGSLNLKNAREAVEREVIREAMARAGNTRQAAKLLGVDHSTVVRKAQRYGIDLREVSTAGAPGTARE
jgi:PAS domain S-box-containing protein